MGCRYVTGDGGKTWRTIPFYDVAGQQGIAVFDKKRIYLMGKGAINISSDKGLTWTILRKFPWPAKDKFNAFEVVGVGSAYLAVGTDHGLWLSADEGKN